MKEAKRTKENNTRNKQTESVRSKKKRQKDGKKELKKRSGCRA